MGKTLSVDQSSERRRSKLRSPPLRSALPRRSKLRSAQNPLCAPRSGDSSQRSVAPPLPRKAPLCVELFGRSFVGIAQEGLRGELFGKDFAGIIWAGLRGSCSGRASWELFGQGFAGNCLSGASQELLGKGFVGVVREGLRGPAFRAIKKPGRCPGTDRSRQSWDRGWRLMPTLITRPNAIMLVSMLDPP